MRVGVKVGEPEQVTVMTAASPMLSAGWPSILAKAVLVMLLPQPAVTLEVHWWLMEAPASTGPACMGQLTRPAPKVPPLLADTKLRPVGTGSLICRLKALSRLLYQLLRVWVPQVSAPVGYPLITPA